MQSVFYSRALASVTKPDVLVGYNGHEVLANIYAASQDGKPAGVLSVDAVKIGAIGDDGVFSQTEAEYRTFIAASERQMTAMDEIFAAELAKALAKVRYVCDEQPREVRHPMADQLKLR